VGTDKNVEIYRKILSQTNAPFSIPRFPMETKNKGKGTCLVSRKQQNNRRRTTRRRSHHATLTLSLRPRPALLSTDYISEIASALQPPIRTIGACVFPICKKLKETIISIPPLSSPRTTRSPPCSLLF